MNKEMNAQVVLNNVNEALVELEAANKMTWNEYFEQYVKTQERGRRVVERGWNGKKVFDMGHVFEELSIFDWWNETLSISQLKKMKKFLETAIKLGFTGYVCFKVGAPGCSHGMWAHKNESTDGYSPDGDVLFHSFRSGDNYWDMELNGEWMHDKYATEEDSCPDFTLSQIKAELA